ncbi:MAG TPA: hypothetical protein VKH83_08120 [Methylomirabilota bacterium]|nr:hypothetical protein [Methylomirabilota bacterium]
MSAGLARRIGRLRLLGAVMLLAAVDAFAGCAPLPPARQVSDVGLIEGRWQGQIKFGLGGYQLFYPTIYPDGRLVASWDAVTRYGQVTVGPGPTRFGLYIWSGTLDYLEGGGERVILMKEDFGSWDAIVRPLK